MTKEEAAEIMRQDIVTLLSQDPHHWLAQLIGQQLMDMEND